MRAFIIVISMCAILSGCESRDDNSLLERVASLERQLQEEASSHGSKMRHIEDRLLQMNKRITDIEGIVGQSLGKMYTSQSNEKVAEDVVKLSNTLRVLQRRIEEVESCVSKINTDYAGVGVPQSDYNKLVEAHNNLVESVIRIAGRIDNDERKINELDDCINSPLGSVAVSPLSWLYDLKRKVDYHCL